MEKKDQLLEGDGILLYCPKAKGFVFSPPPLRYVSQKKLIIIINNTPQYNIYIYIYIIYNIYIYILYIYNLYINDNIIHLINTCSPQVSHVTLYSIAELSHINYPGFPNVHCELVEINLSVVKYIQIYPTH